MMKLPRTADPHRANGRRALLSAKGSAFACARFALASLASLVSLMALVALVALPCASANSAELAPPTLLNYDGNGLEQGFIRYSGQGTLHWSHDRTSYQARLEITAFGLKLRTWNSQGTLNAQGLLPERFEDTTRGGQQNVVFLRDRHVIAYSSGTPDLPLEADAQDKLSALLQLGARIGADPQRYHAGDSIGFQATDAYRAERWEFHVGANEPVPLADGGSVHATKLTKEATPEFDQKIEVWLAPTQAYLPVRLRITEKSGDFVDLLWRQEHTSD